MNLSIGISGLQVAQRAIELIGTNITNASTEGYHRQDMVVSPVGFNNLSTVGVGGAEITAVRRVVDQLLEQELGRQQSTLGQASQMVATLQSVQSVFGDIENDALGNSLSKFFTSLDQLSAQPNSTALREQAVWSADTLASQFRNLSQYMDDLGTQLRLKAQLMASQVNELAKQVADLNGEILSAQSQGGSANLLCDRRDQAIKEIAALVGVQVNDAGGGIANVIAWGTPLVVGNSSTAIEVGRIEEGLGVSVLGANNFRGELRGGAIGAILELTNETIKGFRTQLDTLAREVMSAINRVHVQGVGADGSFTRLESMPQPATAIGQWAQDVTAGDIYIRVTNIATGVATRHKISVDPAADTLADVAARMDAVAGIKASVVNGQLTIAGDSGYTFDFLPAMPAAPATQAIAWSARPTIGGSYTGDANDVFTFRVGAIGLVGITENMPLKVYNQAGELVKTFNIGNGYAAGDPLTIDGITIAMSEGTLLNTDWFTVDALATTDTSGLLAAAGINTFFSGSGATDIKVKAEILQNSNLLACSQSGVASDNLNIRRLAAVGKEALDGLGGATAQDYYRRFVTDIGQTVSVYQTREQAAQQVMDQLKAQREAASGVDVNEQAAQLMVFQRMYQGVAKFMMVEDQAMKYLLDLL